MLRVSGMQRIVNGALRGEIGIGDQVFWAFFTRFKCVAMPHEFFSAELSDQLARGKIRL